MAEKHFCLLPPSAPIFPQFIPQCFPRDKQIQKAFLELADLKKKKQSTKPLPIFYFPQTFSNFFPTPPRMFPNTFLN